MNTTTISQRRRSQAQNALASLRDHRSDRQKLVVECRRAHHVAAVYATDLGLVYVSHIGPHAHGDLDLPDTGHRVERPGREFVDMLHATWADDGLPAWCDCGNRTLSRTDLAAEIAAGRHTLLVD